MQEIKIVDIGWLKPASYNPRKELKPGDVEYESLKGSIQKFGHVQVIVANKDGTIIGGHQTFKVLTDLGHKKARCIVLDLKKKEEKALNLSLNKIQGDWEFNKLKEVFKSFDMDQNIFKVTGFSETEIKQIVDWNPEFVNHDGIEQTPEERLITFNNGMIKQIVLYFSNKDYPEVIKRIKRVREIEGVEENTQAFMRMLNFYEKNSKKENTSKAKKA